MKMKILCLIFILCQYNAFSQDVYKDARGVYYTPDLALTDVFVRSQEGTSIDALMDAEDLYCYTTYSKKFGFAIILKQPNIDKTSLPEITITLIDGRKIEFTSENRIQDYANHYLIRVTNADALDMLRKVNIKFISIKHPSGNTYGFPLHYKNNIKDSLIELLDELGVY